jgi:putative FmdB family regulatory protein
MPLYEYYCLRCDFTFEVLASLNEASKKKSCPECGKRAPRIASAFAIASGGHEQHEGEKAIAMQQPRGLRPHDPRPVCMRYPQVPLSCHMDEPSVRRFAAHAQGRGNEYDDKMAQRAEVRKQRGIPEPVVAPPAHGHDHGHNFRRHATTQGHDHGPHTHTHEHTQTRDKKHSHSHTGRGAGKDAAHVHR